MNYGPLHHYEWIISIFIFLFAMRTAQLRGNEWELLRIEVGEAECLNNWWKQQMNERGWNLHMQTSLSNTFPPPLPPLSTSLSRPLRPSHPYPSTHYLGIWISHCMYLLPFISFIFGHKKVSHFPFSDNNQIKWYNKYISEIHIMFINRICWSREFIVIIACWIT